MKSILSRPVWRWLAVIILLFAYILVSQGLISGQGILFNSLNSVGSILLIVNSLAMTPKDWAVAVFNMVWLVIAMVTMAMVIL